MIEQTWASTMVKAEDPNLSVNDPSLTARAEPSWRDAMMGLRSGGSAKGPRRGIWKSRKRLREGLEMLLSQITNRSHHEVQWGLGHGGPYSIKIKPTSCNPIKFTLASNGGAQDTNLGSFGWEIAVDSDLLWQCKWDLYWVCNQDHSALIIQIIQVSLSTTTILTKCIFSIPTPSPTKL